MSDKRPRLVLFSGLGVDEGLFAPQRRLDASVEIVPWIEARDGESLPAYARRIAETIKPGGPLFLGGGSFGSMVALEAAAALGARGVFIIAGCRSGHELPAIARLGCRLGARLPEPAITAALLSSPLLVRMMGRSNRNERKLLLDLVARSIPWLTRWGCSAMLNWAGPRSLHCPVYHIHGSEDRVIPRRNVRPDMVIPGGGHVINVTHADAVNAFIAQRLGVV